MKTTKINQIRKRNFGLALLLSLSLLGCKDALKEEVFTQIDPEGLLKNEEGVFSLLSSAYGYSDDADRQRINAGEWPTDIAFQSGGFENGRAVLFLNFTWDPSTDILNGFYSDAYQAIRDANVLLDNIDDANIDEEKKQLYSAEARFIRGLSYVRLFNLYGLVPLRTSSDDPLETPRATEEDFRQFIEEDLLSASEHLPEPGKEAAYGRATRGSALAVLCKFQLNTRQWDKAAETAGEVIEMGYYQLFPVYEDMLKVENEGNKEIIWVNAASPLSTARKLSNTYISAAFPPGFQSWPEKDLSFQSNWNNPQTQYRLRDDFFHSFSPNDQRLASIITNYTNNNGESVNLLETPDNTRSFRYWPDPEAQGEKHGNDVPEVRYADILLSRAEALNELNGPNQESIDLINQVRNRAGLENLSMTDFSSKDGLRDHILDERGWEFYSEGLRRQDLVRMDRFIQSAQERGINNAQPHHNLYPLPQAAMDSNPLLEQNPGY